MCGINGIINRSKSIDQNSLLKMNKLIKHRGPDDDGIFVDNNIGFGHTRLSILDLSHHGHQPMVYQDVVLTYNGEVYNFNDIKNDLIKEGIKFDSTSDTEVILKAYHHYGIDFINRLNGMFAFAIYDKRVNKIFLVRDRFGIKPFYIYTGDDQIIFSSEIKAILNHDIEFTLNTDALKQCLSMLYIPAPNTPYNEIQKIKQGYCYEIDLDDFEISQHRYWNMDQKVYNNLTSKDIMENTETLLKDSVEKRMISDVEVGTFLSGGVDSSLVTAMAANISSKKLKTFSISYKGLNDYFDESKYAKAVSDQYKTDHHFLDVDFDSMFDNLEEMIYMLDEPISDTSVFLNYNLSKKTKEHVSVALSGLGADELFGGYNRYQALALNKYMQHTPKILNKSILKMTQLFKENRSSNISNKIRQINKILNSHESNIEDIYINYIDYFDSDFKTLIPNLDISDDLNSILKYDMQYYMSDDLLLLTDKMSMAHSLEIRVPFLDFNLVNYAFNIDFKYKTSIFQKKILLKKLALKYIDNKLVYRRKQGFAAPIDIWLKNKGQNYITSLIDFEFLNKIISQEKISLVIDNFFNQKRDYSIQVYTFIVLSLWNKINGKYYE